MLERLSEGGCGETIAPIGIERSEGLPRRSRRESAKEGVSALETTDGCMERVEVARDRARRVGEGGALSLFGSDPVLAAPYEDPGLECAGLGAGDAESRTRLGVRGASVKEFAPVEGEWVSRPQSSKHIRR